MFEPTETESPQTLEALAEALERIEQRAIADPDSLHRAPRPRRSHGWTRPGLRATWSRPRTPRPVSDSAGFV